MRWRDRRQRDLIVRWRDRRQSDNIEDRIGQRISTSSGRRSLGGGALIIMLLVSVFFGENVSQIVGLFLGNNQQTTTDTQYSAPIPGQDDEAAEFVSVILAETEDTWSRVFAGLDIAYQPPKLVLYTGQVQSACGIGLAQAGPFYCPGDYQIYLDLSFLQDLRRMGAPGDFAFAYVIAHEVGHHVQNLVGVAQDVRSQQANASQAQANLLSVKMELQADCLAGIWINHTQKCSAILEDGDIEEGLAAAAAVGNDRILSQAGRAINREAFTHGSSVERVQWFKQGASTGELSACNSFS